jgi:hypothetical protein
MRLTTSARCCATTMKATLGGCQASNLCGRQRAELSDRRIVQLVRCEPTHLIGRDAANLRRRERRR